MTKYFDVSFSDSLCVHSDTCGCAVTVSGISEHTQGYNAVHEKGTFPDRIVEAAVGIGSGFEIIDEIPVRTLKDPETEYIKLLLQKKSGIVPVGKVKGVNGSWPQSREMPLLNHRVRSAIMRADVKIFRKLGISVGWYELSKTAWRTYPTRKVKLVRHGKKFSDGQSWIPEEVVVDPKYPVVQTGISEDIPSLGSLIMRKLSIYHQTLGTYKGRPFVVGALSDLFDHKYTNSVLNMNRPTHVPPPEFKSISHIVQPAMDLLYHKMKIKGFQKIPSKLTFLDLRDMYLGAANGINVGPEFEIFWGDGESISVSAKGKKCDTYLSDIEAILEFLRGGDKPMVYWNVTPKNENFFSWAKQQSDADWNAWKAKLRLFVIPSSTFIHMERMASRIRVLKERGWVISVGHAHSHGGADKIARMLGIHLANCRSPIIEEGDAKNFDQTVLEFFVNLYYSTMLIHEDPTSEDYAMKKKLVDALIEDITSRFTRIFGDVFAWVRGQVPSGCWNTSHMDSWVMAMYFMMFGLHQISTAPEEDQEELEDHLLNIVMLIVYGDDHLWNKGEGKCASYFGAHQFAEFCKTYLGVTIRDIVTGATFVSDVCNGWITRRGATFLKHQFIINPCKAEGQCTFLPFRESREFLIRAVWGRETKMRDSLDVIMSTIGHAYGTYASNRDAYDRLYFLYESLVEEMNVPSGVLLSDVVRRLGRDDLKKLRQVGIESDDLLKGFPTWETLQDKNVMDWVYQDTVHDFEEI